MRRPAWRRWTATSASCRLPIAMAPLALVLVGHNATGSFATGAIMASSYTFAEALSAPAAGRLLGRAGDLRRGFAGSLAAAALILTGLGAVSLAGFPAVALIALSAVAGAAPSGGQGGLRATVTLTLAPLLAHVGASAADAGFLLAGLSAASAIGGLAYSLARVANRRAVPTRDRPPPRCRGPSPDPFRSGPFCLADRPRHRRLRRPDRTN